MSQQDKPLVSIILPVYNAKNHIARCIESIRAQTYQNIQIIVLNDGSKDISLPVCEMYRKVDPRILLVDKDNSGVSDTRNLGLRLAQGKYIQFVDSDDYMDPDYTEHLVCAAEEQDADLVIAPYKMVIPREMASGCRLQEKLAVLLPGEDPGPDQDEEPEIRVYNFLPRGLLDTEGFALHLMDKPASYYYSVLWNKLYRSEILANHEIFFASQVHWAEDLLFNLQYIQYARRFYAIDQPGYYYVQNPQSIIHTQISPAAIVKMKTTVFPYYKALYEKLGLYEENKAAIRRYLVDISESSLPSGPLENVVSGAMEKWDTLTTEAANALGAASAQKRQSGSPES